ncbi:hypothetical protein BmHG_00228 [Borrelia miyamotoi]|uniref:Uncharacterized protein n=1 Tax=Borrelia miyamotoi TaxID=47466 RepID=A0AAP9CG01_9SPIR|nr:hypothetical protein [Borrelia miyamotoi]AHH05194.1 Hypothetical protein BOM_0651 [Borrelia miyamotoi FR64b]ATQ14976.1 hypothetical protein CNO14_03160 [Borrelia miyamotoi]ATQ16159.1 hypothetical protein CNO13_03160 [Borrelia miyamotoi]ATQ17304.1 hypothetical protein CNO12_03165 [Borrelia miyamotoi]ATQ18190.1 hypothetical protein CNO11_01085 [Borrelia miyamotoi]
MTIGIYTKDVDNVEKIRRDIAKFYDKDISLFCVEELNYCFDKIDDIKLEMVSDSIQNCKLVIL